VRAFCFGRRVCRLPSVPRNGASHWPHVAEQVQQQLQQLVAELVEQHLASVKALGLQDLGNYARCARNFVTLTGNRGRQARI